MCIFIREQSMCTFIRRNVQEEKEGNIHSWSNALFYCTCNKKMIKPYVHWKGKLFGKPLIINAGDTVNKVEWQWNTGSWIYDGKCRTVHGQLSKLH